MPITGVTVSIRFGDDDRVSGEGGCNSYNAAYTTSGSKHDHRPEHRHHAAPVPGCGGCGRARVPRAPPEGAERTRSAARPSRSSARATRSCSSTRRRAVAAALSGHWEATSYYTGNAIQSAIIGTTLTADFTKTTISGDAGCNLFNGPYTTSGTDTIAIGPLASTLRACADPAVGTQEQQYLAALQLAKTYRVTGDKLELLRDGGTIAAIFHRGK